jgi:hypothetical protein
MRAGRMDGEGRPKAGGAGAESAFIIEQVLPG